MTGLKPYARDPELPGLAGDASLCIPDAARVAELVDAHLGCPGGPRVERTEVEYARWKPGQSLTCTFTVGLSDGVEEIVVLKKYLDGKAHHVARHYEPSSHVGHPESPLAPVAILEDRGLCLFRFPADRVLRGAARVLNPKRHARRIDALDGVAPLVVRQRASKTTLLRFKPERRAVFRTDAKLRGPAGQREVMTFGVRVLPPEVARTVVRRRARLADRERHVPRLLDAEADSGILIEEWIPGRTLEETEFEAAHRAGAQLGRFHAPLDSETVHAKRRAQDASGLGSLFEVDAGLVELWSRVRFAPSPPPTHWIHGDFHPNQLLSPDDADRPSTLALLDLDALAPGRPEQDLGSWIADHLALHAGASLADAARPLVDGYAELATAPSESALRASVHRHLVHYAAASVRRLERGAVRKARRLLERALDLQPRAEGSA